MDADYDDCDGSANGANCTNDGKSELLGLGRHASEVEKVLLLTDPVVIVQACGEL